MDHFETGTLGHRRGNMWEIVGVMGSAAAKPTPIASDNRNVHAQGPKSTAAAIAINAPLNQ